MTSRSSGVSPADPRSNDEKVDLSDRIIGSADPALVTAGRRHWQLIDLRRNVVELALLGLLVACGWWFWGEAAKHGHRPAVVVACLPVLLATAVAFRRPARPRMVSIDPTLRWWGTLTVVELGLAAAAWWSVQREGLGWSVLVAVVLIMPLMSLVAGPVRFISRGTRAFVVSRRRPDLVRADLALALAQSDGGPAASVLEAWRQTLPIPQRKQLSVTGLTDGSEVPSAPAGLRRSIGESWVQAEVVPGQSTVVLSTSDALSAQVELPRQLRKRHGWNENHARTVLTSLLAGGPVLLITAPDGRWAGRARTETAVVTLYTGTVPRRSHTDPVQRPGPYLFSARLSDGAHQPGIRVLPPTTATGGNHESDATPQALTRLVDAVAAQTPHTAFTTTPLRGPAALRGVRMTTADADPRHVDLYALNVAPNHEVLVCVPDLDLWVRYPKLNGEWFRAPAAIAALLARAEKLAHHKDGTPSIEFGPTTI